MHTTTGVWSATKAEAYRQSGLAIDLRIGTMLVAKPITQAVKAEVTRYAGHE